MGEVKPLNNDDIVAEELLVCLDISRVKRANRKVVDSDKLESPVDQITCGCMVDTCVVFIKCRLVQSARVVIDFEEEPSARFREVLRRKVFSRKDALARDVEDVTGSDECGQLECVHETTAGDKVPGGIKVRCRMCAHIDVCDFSHIAIFVRRGLGNANTWMPGPDRRAVGCGYTDIEWEFLHS